LQFNRFPKSTKENYRKRKIKTMAALSTFAELMARASVTVFTQLCNNALEKAQQQQQQQHQNAGKNILKIQKKTKSISFSPFSGAVFSPILPPLISVPPNPSISPKELQKTAEQQAEKKDHNHNNHRYKSEDKNTRKRKKTSSCEITTTTAAAVDDPMPLPLPPTEETVDHLLLLSVPTDRQSSISPPSNSRISSPDSNSVHKARKLKLYAAEGKFN
jgi:hypothetical protein